MTLDTGRRYKFEKLGHGFHPAVKTYTCAARNFPSQFRKRTQVVIYSLNCPYFMEASSAYSPMIKEKRKKAQLQNAPQRQTKWTKVL
jgi:hypothetical protein